MPALHLVHVAHAQSGETVEEGHDVVVGQQQPALADCQDVAVAGLQVLAPVYADELAALLRPLQLPDRRLPPDAHPNRIAAR